MKTNTAIMGGYTDRSELKRFATARQKRQDLRLKLDALEAEGQADSPRWHELRAQISILTELIGESYA